MLQKNSPILVAVSFGPDSMALLDRLYRRGFLSLHVAHVHHGLRVESDQEKDALEQFCQMRDLVFHCHRLQLEKGVMNLEDRLRNERHQFFQQIYKKIGAEVLFLGHQADEQVETGLKRIFEGASHLALGGMQIVKEIYGMRVCRPQLYETKESLLLYLAKAQVPYAVDASNVSEKFLRGKMRVAMVPYLKEIFGKELTANLLHHMEKMDELTHYLDRRIAFVMEKVVGGPYGIYVPKEVFQSLDPFEQDHLLLRLKVAKRHTRKRICLHLKNGDFGKNVKDDIVDCYIEQVGLFFLEHAVNPEFFLANCAEEKGWLAFWQGKTGYHLPQKTEKWVPLLEINGVLRKKVQKKYSAQNTPIFLRKSVYVLEDQGKVIYEFLTL